MKIEEEKCVEIVVRSDDPTPGEIQLKNIGFLKKEPTYVNCPACESVALSVVRLEAVTCLQRFLKATKWCKNWESRADINHYCCKCGCFIGRFVNIGCGERCISRYARRKAAVSEMSLKTKPKDCAAHMQKMRQHVKSERAKEKAKKEAKKQEAEENIKVESTK